MNCRTVEQCNDLLPRKMISQSHTELDTSSFLIWCSGSSMPAIKTRRELTSSFLWFQSWSKNTSACSNHNLLLKPTCLVSGGGNLQLCTRVWLWVEKNESKPIHRYLSKKGKALPHLTWQSAVLIYLDCAVNKMRMWTRTRTRMWTSRTRSTTQNRRGMAKKPKMKVRTRNNGGGWLEELFLEVWDRSRGSNLIEIWERKIWEKARQDLRPVIAQLKPDEILFGFFEKLRWGTSWSSFS